MSSSGNWNNVAVDLRRATTAKGRQQLGRMVVEGKRLLLRAVRAGYPPRQLAVAESLMSDGHGDAATVLAEVANLECEVFVVPDRQLLETSDGRNSGLLVGLCDLPATDCSRALQDDGRPVLCLVNIDEPGNVGAMMRTALASGACALVSVGGCDLFHPKAVRTSLGSIFTLPLIRVGTIDEVLELTSKRTRLAAVAQDGKAPWEVTVASPPALFMGNEGSGLPDSVVEVLDEPVTIPMPVGVDSFSVNAAAAVLLYELARRRAAST